MIQAEGARIAEGADPADKEKISRQLETLKERWSSLLQQAQTRSGKSDLAHLLSTCASYFSLSFLYCDMCLLSSQVKQY